MSARLTALLLCCITAAACSAYDGDLLGRRDAGPRGGGVQDGGTQLDAGSGMPDCGAPCADPCNGEDDDQDGTIDEGEDACRADHAEAVCLAGECVIVQCDAEFRDCDGRASDGCEVALGQTSSCAGCGDDCAELEGAVEATCSSDRTCRIVRCQAGSVDCDGDPTTGCEASFSDALNCGGCASTGDNEPCTDLPNVLTSSCTLERCAIDTCLPDFVDCNGMAADGCEQEIAVEGCCPDEPDSDGDLTLDCLDGCKDDPDKTEPGACGCGISDVDMDVDGVADCRTDCWGFPSNFDPFDTALSFAIEGNLTCSPTIDTSQPPASMISGWCNGDAPVPVVRPQATGPDAVIVALRGLTIAAGHTLRLIGDKPIVIAIEGDAHIAGALDAGSNRRTTAGAGAAAACTSGNGQPGANAANDGAAAGGGGGFATAGGRGGSSDDGPGGAGGTAASASARSLVPLRAGCQGGRGGNDGNSGGGTGGFGGGALQLSVAGLLRVAGTGVISASGGGGARGTGPRDGGGGGGSGGAVLLEANVIELEQGAWVTANGGSGAAGNSSGGVCSNADGRDGNPTSAIPTTGGAGCGGSGPGGSGAAANGGATSGSSTGGNEAAGAGGGGLGVISMQPLAGSVCAQ